MVAQSNLRDISGVKLSEQGTDYTGSGEWKEREGIKTWLKQVDIVLFVEMENTDRCPEQG